MPTLLDSARHGYPASNAYALSHVPSMFLVERDGTISWSLVGFHKKELEALGARFGVQSVPAGGTRSRDEVRLRLQELGSGPEPR